MRFAVQTSDRNTHEGQTILWYATMAKLERMMVGRATGVEKGWVPVGRVPWVEEVLGGVEVPDYYPAFLEGWLHRKLWRQDDWPHHRCFVKPADRHKRFTGFVTRGGWKGRKRGPLWVSEIVAFVSEWRYYVAYGKVLAAKWGSGVESEPPALPIDWPPTYSGAVDFGLLDNGKVALIEANSPFSCGWYGSVTEGAVYAEWLALGWQYMLEKRANDRA